MRNVNPEWYYGWDKEPDEEECAPQENDCGCEGILGNMCAECEALTFQM